MSIDFEHRDHAKFAPRWKQINDICDSDGVKDYILPLNPNDESVANKNRNTQFKDRAVFHAVAGRTANGLLGLVFQKDPSVEIPDGLKYLERNADGGGVSIYQQSQELVEELIKVGVSGLWVDFPNSEGSAVSAADIRSGKAFSTITHFHASQIWNWRTTQVGSEVKLNLVVIKTVDEVVGEDGYSTSLEDMFLELFLGGTESSPEAMIYQVRKWKKSKDTGQWEIVDYFVPTDGDGNVWDEIPFVFCGSSSNTWRIDQPPMYPLVSLNIAHYNNSAIYEDSVFTVGQAQPWMSGLNLEDAKAWEEEGHYVGSGRLMGTPPGEKLDFAQVKPNTLAREAMKDKMEAMIGLGALFIQPGSAVKTATQSEGEQKVDHSILSLIAANAGEAYTTAIKWCGKFMRVNAENVVYEINDDYVDPRATSQDLQQVVASFLQDALPISDYLDWMKKHGFVRQDKTLEDFTEEVRQSEGELDLGDDGDEDV